MRYVLTFPHAKQNKTIHDSFTIKHLFHEEKLNRRIHELHEILWVQKVQSNSGDKVLLNSWRILYRMKVGVWRLTYAKVWLHVWHDKKFVGAKAPLPATIGKHTHSCMLLVVKAGNKQNLFNFAVRFIMLLSLCHLAAIRGTILESKRCNPYTYNHYLCSPVERW